MAVFFSSVFCLYLLDILVELVLIKVMTQHLLHGNTYWCMGTCALTCNAAQLRGQATQHNREAEQRRRAEISQRQRAKSRRAKSRRVKASQQRQKAKKRRGKRNKAKAEKAKLETLEEEAEAEGEENE